MAASQHLFIEKVNWNYSSHWRKQEAAQVFSKINATAEVAVQTFRSAMHFKNVMKPLSATLWNVWKFSFKENISTLFLSFLPLQLVIRIVWERIYKRRPVEIILSVHFSETGKPQISVSSTFMLDSGEIKELEEIEMLIASSSTSK